MENRNECFGFYLFTKTFPIRTFQL